MRYDRAQLEVIRAINQIARQRYASDPAKKRRYSLTQFEISSVETGHRNLDHGDSDSAGYRQERKRFYPDNTNLSASINRAFDEMEKLDHGQTTGELAADVQRPRADLRGKYQTRLQEARSLVKDGGSSVTKAKVSGSVTPGTAPTLTPGGETTDTKGAVTAALLDNRKGMSLLGRLKDAISSGKYTTTTLPKVTAGSSPKYNVGTATTPSAGGAAGTPAGNDLKARADAIDKKHMPYLWGGGHAGKVDAFNAAPLDCSGAVSAVLGINPRVSGEFTKWGKPGDGGSKGVTVAANGHHVLMKINGHWFGTSGSNPGGGAGWIPQAQISPGYLKGFTLRHE